MVAEAAPAPTTEVEAPIAQEAPPTEAAPPPTEAAPEASTDGEPVASTDGEATEQAFDVTALPEWQEAVKAPIAAKEPEIPGTPLAGIERQAAQERSQAYQALLRNGQQVVTNHLANLNFNSEEQAAVWQAIQPLINGMHGNADLYYQQLLNESFRLALPEGEREQFFSRAYPEYPDAIKAVREIARASERAEWQEKVKKGEFVTQADVKKIAQASFNKGRGIREKAGEVEGADAGNVVNGVSQGGRFRSEHELNVAFNTEGSPIYNNRAVYAREYKRLTGREP